MIAFIYLFKDHRAKNAVFSWFFFVCFFVCMFSALQYKNSKAKTESSNKNTFNFYL